jgi:hypothetical protein
MPTATEQRNARRRAAMYRARIQQATTATGELWAAIAWLVAEARRARRVNDTTQAVLVIVRALTEGKDLHGPP